MQPDNDVCVFYPVCSFVRSVTMDKWKDIELEKMKAGGNGKFRLFLELQDDYDPTWTLQEKYNSKAAALFRDKVKYAELIVIKRLHFPGGWTVCFKGAIFRVLTFILMSGMVLLGL